MFIIRLILWTTNGIDFNKDLSPRFPRLFTIFVTVIVIGIPSYVITEPLLDLINSITANQFERYISDFIALSLINYSIDILRLLLSTVLVLKYYRSEIGRIDIKSENPK